MSQPSETTHVPAVPDLVAEAGASGDGRTGTLIEALHEGVVIQDVGGRIVAANSRAEEVLGLTRSQLTGLTSLDPR
jgi:PAS domain-containing protein